MNKINEQIHQLTIDGLNEIRQLIREKGTIHINEDKYWIALYVDNDGYGTSSDIRSIELETNEKLSVGLDDGICLYEEELTTNHVLDILSLIEETEEENSTPLISRQFRRKSHDGSMCRGFGFWEDMAEPRTWNYLVQLMPNYYSSDDVAFSDDLSCVVGGDHEEKDLEWLYENYEEYDGFTIEQVQEVLNKWDAELYDEAEEYLSEAVKSGEIEVREFSVSTTSARIFGIGESDCVHLVCADETDSYHGKEFTVASCNLQNVKSRWIDEDTYDEQFQIYYESKTSTTEYWCNAQSIDFE